MIYLGTSGFSHNDFGGNSYPVGIPECEWHTGYTRFPCSFSFDHPNWNYWYGQAASTIRQPQAMLD